MSNKKLLVSGCGFSWSGQERKTWVNVLRSVGMNITDVGGPAVSNQWILNRAFEQLLAHRFDHVVIQITSIGKLDVEILDDRFSVLVEPDTLRNFTVDGVWPSSHSREHEAKALYQDLLASPGLETQDLYCKLILLDHWCETHKIKLTVLQAYEIPWTAEQHAGLSKIIHNINQPLYHEYRASEHYQLHDTANHNAVPCLEYHCELAQIVVQLVAPELSDRISKIQKFMRDS